MKKILLKLALLGATLFAYQAAKAQTVSVTADLKTMFNAGAATKTQVCFSLTDGNGNQLSNPRTSSGVIVPTATQCVLPDGSGHVSTTVIANDQITPANSIYSVTYTFNGRVVHGDIFQFALVDVTENLNIKTALSTIPVVPTPTGDTTYLRLDGGNGPLALLTVTGTSTLANVNLGIGNTLSLNNIKQQAGTAFVLADPNGVSHFFISSGAPYTNTFINGNGSGVVFLGSAAKTSVADTTGNIVTSGNLTLQTTSGTLPAVVANDTAGGILFTNNAGKTLQFGNGGTLFLGSSGSRGQAIGFFGATSGDATLVLAATGSSNVITLPNVTDTLACVTCSQTLTGKTITNLGITGGATNALLRFNSSAQIINGNTTDDGTNFSTNTVKLQVQSGVTQGSGFKHQRGTAGCVTGAVIGNTCQTVITWTSAFADANYTVVGCMGNGVTSGFPVINAFGSKLAASISVQTATVTAAASQFTTIECTAVHD